MAIYADSIKDNYIKWLGKDNHKQKMSTAFINYTGDGLKTLVLFFWDYWVMWYRAC